MGGDNLYQYVPNPMGWVDPMELKKYKSSSDVIRRLKEKGWVLDRVKGSHHQFKHPTRPGLVTVPHPKRELPTGTLRNIYRQAGWAWE